MTASTTEEAEGNREVGGRASRLHRPAFQQGAHRLFEPRDAFRGRANGADGLLEHHALRGVRQH
jgi:hypothetical protein